MIERRTAFDPVDRTASEIELTVNGRRYREPIDDVRSSASDAPSGMIHTASGWNPMPVMSFVALPSPV